MEVLVTIPDKRVREILIPPDVARRLEELGSVTWNPDETQFTEAELRERIAGIEVCVTGWGSPRLTENVLENATELKLVTHVGGSVASVASETLFDREIPICSAIGVMGPFVAEGILGMTLAALREIPQHDAELKRGEWNRDRERGDTLFGKTVGFVGLGTVGQALLDLLAPFDVTVSIYDPYITAERIAGYDFAELVSLESVLRNADIVSIHAAKTRETIGLLDAERLATLRDGALLVNAARGAIVDTEALTAQLRAGRLSAALDVFEPEPLPADSELRALDNVVLTPHKAGSPARHRLTEAMIEEVERFARDDPLEHRIPRERFETMTEDALTPADRTDS